MNCPMPGTGATPLYMAVENGYVAATEALSGLDVNIRLSDGSSVMHAVALKGHIQLINILKREGARFNLADNKGRTPLYLAAQRKDEATMTALLFAGENIKTAIEFATLAKEPECKEVESILTTLESKLAQKNNRTKTSQTSSPYHNPYALYQDGPQKPSNFDEGASVRPS